MVTARVRRRLAALREPASAVRIARALWIAFAVVVWNVVFDRVIVVAGRDYIRAAVTVAGAAGESRPFPPARLNMDEWMRPAATHGLWIATAAAAAILLVGLLSVRAAARAATPHG
jgi:hypothetical protein